MKYYIYNPERDDAFIAVVEASSKKDAARKFITSDTSEHKLSSEEIEADIESMLDNYIFVSEDNLYRVKESRPGPVTSVDATTALNKARADATKERIDYLRKPKKDGLDLDVADMELDIEELKIPDIKMDEINIGF